MSLFLESDRQSATWQKLRAHIESRLALHSRAMERDHGKQATAKLRGRMAELRALLEDAEPTRLETPE